MGQEGIVTIRKVLLVDDHPILRQGLTQLINASTDLVVCGEASTAREALDLLETLNPDIVIVDISLEDRNGVELIKDIGGRNPQLPCLALSMYDESMYALRVLRAGGRGQPVPPPDQAMNSCNQDVQLERLSQIIVGARSKSSKNIIGAASRRQH